MASCIGNIRTKYYQNLIIDFQVTVKNVWMLFWDAGYKHKLHDQSFSRFEMTTCDIQTDY